MLKPKPTSSTRHWEGISDDRLINLDLEIDSPDTLENLMLTVPDGDETPHVEFRYDRRGEALTDFMCVHGHHHKSGFVMRKGSHRFLVGCICGKTVYNEDFDGYTADFDAAVARKAALVRVREIRDGIQPFMAWLETRDIANAVREFSRVRGQLLNYMPWIFDNLPALARQDPRVTGGKLPRDLCAEPTDIREDYKRLLNETAIANSGLIGDAIIVAAKMPSHIARLSGLAKRAEALLCRLEDVSLFFQPSVLAYICETATANDHPKRRRYLADLIKISLRDTGSKTSIELSRDFKIPSRQPVEHLVKAITA